jgi:hypothetical protein
MTVRIIYSLYIAYDWFSNSSFIFGVHLLPPQGPDPAPHSFWTFSRLSAPLAIIFFIEALLIALHMQTFVNLSKIS